jgi:hypothetical protein
VNHAALTHALVLDCLQNWRTRQWQLQGFGMLRTYLPNDVRLHVWSGLFAIPGVTTIHDHPWDFDSLVVAGRLHNTRFHAFKRLPDMPAPNAYMMRSIKPGVGLQVIADDAPVWLRKCATETYEAGSTYRQAANEIHESRPEDGTVTLVHRRRVGADVARSFYEADKGWVSAEPREATEHEARAIIEHSLATWRWPSGAGR